MSASKPEVPALPGFLAAPGGSGGEAQLLGTRCKACGTYYFPRETTFCRSPVCEGADFEEVPLSRTGRLWSFTSNGYEPPPPYVSPTKPFVPFAIAAVELAREKIVVLGMVVAPFTCADLKVGMEMEIVADVLFEDDEKTQLVWKFRPVRA